MTAEVFDKDVFNTLLMSSRYVLIIPESGEEKQRFMDLINDNKLEVKKIDKKELKSNLVEDSDEIIKAGNTLVIFSNERKPRTLIAYDIELPPDDITEMIDRMKNKYKVIVFCGPPYSEKFVEYINSLGWPVLTDKKSIFKNAVDNIPEKPFVVDIDFLVDYELEAKDADMGFMIFKKGLPTIAFKSKG